MTVSDMRNNIPTMVVNPPLRGDDANKSGHHMAYLRTVAEEDIQQVRRKEKEYGSSWKSRGGVGAFMMLARKWDRLENMVQESRTYEIKAGVSQDHGGGYKSEMHAVQGFTASSYDILEHSRLSELERGDSENLLDTIGDLRRYLLLVEAEVRARRGDPVPASGQASAL